MTRRRLATLASLILLGACAPADTTAPRTDGASARSLAPSAGQSASAASKVGAKANPSASNGKGHDALPCPVAAPLSGSALIGASGGELMVGPHKLIVPPGALTQTTLLSGTVAAGSMIRIDFEPHGLQFKKPAGLVLFAADCGEVPDVVYLNEDGGIAERIEAIYSKLWHTIAAPIEHFSGYMLEV